MPGHSFITHHFIPTSPSLTDKKVLFFFFFFSLGHNLLEKEKNQQKIHFHFISLKNTIQLSDVYV